MAYIKIIQPEEATGALTIIPWKMDSDDIRILRDLGLSDRDILDAVEVISYFNYINRIADALGVDHEPWMKR